MTDFLSNVNKEFIWSLLSEQKIFDGINPKYKLEIQEKFEKTLIGISTQGRFYNLVEKNKEAIRLMVLMLDDYKRKQEPYTALEIQELRQKNFDNELQKKKNEFTGPSNKPIMNEMNFADVKDSPLEESMDVLLARAMSVRENQLNQVLDRQDTQVASEWIGTSKTSGIKSNSNIKTNNSTNVINLKIGSETSLNDDHVVSLDVSKNSRVSFNEKQNSVFTYERENDEENNNLIDNTSILSKFKKTNNTTTNIINNKTNNQNVDDSIENINLEMKLLNAKLDKVLLNQMDILECINNMRIK